MSDNFVTCRHCGIGINYACDHEETDVPAEEVAELREKLKGINVLKCLLVDAERARDEALNERDALRVATNTWADSNLARAVTVLDDYKRGNTRLDEMLRMILGDLENLHAMTCATADAEGECLGCTIAGHIAEGYAVLGGKF